MVSTYERLVLMYETNVRTSNLYGLSTKLEMISSVMQDVTNDLVVSTFHL